MAARVIYGKQLRQRKYKLFDFEGIWQSVFGKPERSGFWLIYGGEKNGKTWFSLKLAEYLSQFEKVLYVSAEQGMSKSFQETHERAGIDVGNRRLQFLDYHPINELEEILDGKRTSPKIIFIDNITIYKDELQYGEMRRLQRKYSNRLFVFVAHEERNQPYTAPAKLCKKLSEIIIRVKGLACEIGGRCPGGALMIDEQRATLYYGTEEIKELGGG